MAREAVRYLASDGQVEQVTVVGRDRRQALGLIELVAAPAGVNIRAAGADDIGHAIAGHHALIVASGGPVRPVAAVGLERGLHVVAAADDPVVVRALLGLDAEGRERGLSVAVGACLAPGLGCVLAARAASTLDKVEEIHTASLGTGGPACARRHHSALSSLALDWYDGAWHRAPGGSGRTLVWFPEPVGGADCYRGALADPLLLVPAFPGVSRVTARLEATRRDRLTAWLPMMRRPHPEGTVGAVRAEARGWRRGLPADCILGAVVRPALGAGLVAALTARRAASGRLSRPGAGGLAELVADPGAFLADMAGAGVRTSLFEGTSPDPADPATA